MQNHKPCNDDLKNTLCRTIENVRQESSDFDLNSGVVLPKGRVLKPAAVLIAITEAGEMILTKRAAHLKHHAGQIAFAGGRMDETDRDLTHTALREAQEEIGLDPSVVNVLGSLPTHETVTSYSITPIVAMVPSGLKFTPEPGEVEEAFTVPLSHVLSPMNYRIEGRVWQGQKRYYYSAPYGPYYIWGATARILRGMAEAAQ
ncbi:NUDIX domain-containing protein [Octadecabacter temperatus]|uniref:Putative NUDIX hydrolase n=1 Tax=Octadecabacter temperatus TaxID=1458307 RepID=A0A0K0Y9S7_9RHOB|nr:CoA pyrophosphatase [Octadecabacter temperatus]AKS47704.1 putative NUDIX hydrolase [Octadecabacter temperatus]SIO39634.1 NUDIX domain-containing protein [Octadecabacter temperatus]